jgi:hypothetical protein
MTEKPKLENVGKGYAEVSFKYGWGYVTKKEYVVRTDFDKDEIAYAYRWEAYVYRKPVSIGFSQFKRIGRLTGYRTRKEAIEALRKFLKDVESVWGTKSGYYSPAIDADERCSTKPKCKS